MNRYILRYVAGTYWLAKVDQQDTDYTAPVMLNEMGAFLCKYMMEGYEVQELSKMLQNMYGIDTEEAFTDVMQFYNQLTGMITI
ncbi:MAG: hypothetical protein K0R46_1887 [Herbinix sp.]|jgi:hypothetical protein|nr:hypothetical protein [Herbinix sp.]